MTKLKDIMICNTNITQEGISKLVNVIELRCQFSTNIISLNHMEKLKVINLRYSNVSQEGIDQLRNIKTIYSLTPHITSLNHLKDLKILNLSYSNVNQVGISKLENDFIIILRIMINYF